jgi:hypothetical protein
MVVLFTLRTECSLFTLKFVNSSRLLPFSLNANCQKSKPEPQVSRHWLNLWKGYPLNKEELTLLLSELDEALLEAFPGPEPLRVLVVGGACLLWAGVIQRPTKDIDVIITDLFGTGEATLVYDLTKTTRKLRTLISKIGKKHGLKGNDAMFLNDDCAPFLMELGDIPPMRELQSYRKIQLFIPQDLTYILACKLMAGRPTKDYDDIAALRQLLNVRTRAQAEWIVNSFFPDPILQHAYGLSKTLDELFGKNQ